MSEKNKNSSTFWFLVKLFVCPATKDLQTVAVRSESVETQLCQLCTGADPDIFERGDPESIKF